MSPDATYKMFLGAAVFNWIIGLGLFLVPDIFLSLFFIAPTPDQSVWVQEFAGLVTVFGIGYYWAAKDFHNNRSIVRLAVWGKSAVVLIALLNVIRGDASWQFMIPAAGDAVFVVLFILALKSSERWQLGGAG
jgi:hypothetical protein